MMYHKNRLIKAYERVGCQLKVGFVYDLHLIENQNWAFLCLGQSGLKKVFYLFQEKVVDF